MGAVRNHDQRVPARYQHPAHLLTEQSRAAVDSNAERNPTRRFGTPYEDCAPLLVFLASDGAGYVNGQAIGVDGGMFLLA